MVVNRTNQVPVFMELTIQCLRVSMELCRGGLLPWGRKFTWRMFSGDRYFIVVVV